MNETECRFCEKQAGDTGTCEMINWCRQDVRACDHYVPQKKIYFKLPPELVDGEHWTVVEKISTVLEAVETWCGEFKTYAGESVEIETVEMTTAAVAAMPEI